MDESRNYLSVGIKQNEIMSENHKKVCKALNYFEHFLSQSSRKKRKKHIVLLVNTIEVLVSKALSDSYIDNDEFISVNNVLREYDEIKNVIKNPENVVEYTT